KVEPPINSYDAWLDSICSHIYDPHKENYQNEKGEYSKGGLLAAVLYNNYILVEGEKTNYAKQMGHDYSDPFDPHRTDDYGMINSNNTKRYEIGKEDEWQKLMQKLAYEMLNANKLKAPKKLDDYETFEEFLKAALQYSQKKYKFI
ncbi:hypothetical protein AVCANL283_08720, partial [Campylobacter canadensis]|nr:hypothetical protein [Campylobacter canadensis]